MVVMISQLGLKAGVAIMVKEIILIQRWKVTMYFQKYLLDEYVSTSSHLNTIISKTLNYESNPYMNENWFQRACLVGDPNTQVSCVITNEHINEILDLLDLKR